MKPDFRDRKKLYRTWIEVSTAAVRHNVAFFRRLIGPRTKLLGVVKSNAYGHELVAFAQTLCDGGIDCLGVDSITEANTLRKRGIQKPILVLGYTLPSHFELAAHHNINIAVSTFESLRALSKQKHALHIHIKIDTGMHRQGFYLADVSKILTLLKQARHIRLDGVFTHFASAKKPDTTKKTEKQLSQFRQAIRGIKKEYPDILAHAAATAGTLNYPESHFNMVRIGIGMYGYWPSPETKTRLDRGGTLRPALSWHTSVSEIKTVEKDAKIGYDYTEAVKKRSKIAILPVGYWHGYFRALSGIGHVLIGGKRCKVLGRVSMDMLVVDVSGLLKVKVGDEVVLIGKQSKEFISADELGGQAKTTCYEFLTRLNPLIKKFYI